MFDCFVSFGSSSSSVRLHSFTLCGSSKQRLCWLLCLPSVVCAVRCFVCMCVCVYSSRSTLSLATESKHTRKRTRGMVGTNACLVATGRQLLDSDKTRQQKRRRIFFGLIPPTNQPQPQPQQQTQPQPQTHHKYNPTNPPTNRHPNKTASQ